MGKKFKTARQKKSKSIFFLGEIAFLAVLNFFPSSKIDFWTFLKVQKISEIDFFDFTSFFLVWTFLNILA